MSESRFSQFYTNNANASSSEFKETFTIEELQQDQNGALMQVLPCTDPSKAGHCYFACGMIRGSVSKDLVDKLKSKDENVLKNLRPVVVSHVVHKPTADYPNEFDGLLMHEQGSNNAIATW